MAAALAVVHNTAPRAELSRASQAATGHMMPGLLHTGHKQPAPAATGTCHPHPHSHSSAAHIAFEKGLTCSAAIHPVDLLGPHQTHTPQHQAQHSCGMSLLRARGQDGGRRSPREAGAGARAGVSTAAHGLTSRPLHQHMNVTGHMSQHWSY